MRGSRGEEGEGAEEGAVAAGVDGGGAEPAAGGDEGDAGGEGGRGGAGEGWWAGRRRELRREVARARRRRAAKQERELAAAGTAAGTREEEAGEAEAARRRRLQVLRVAEVPCPRRMGSRLARDACVLQQGREGCGEGCLSGAVARMASAAYLEYEARQAEVRRVVYVKHRAHYLRYQVPGKTWLRAKERRKRSPRHPT